MLVKVNCEYCGGAGGEEITYAQAGFCPYGCSNDRAERYAGEVHHFEPCDYCNGDGWVYEDDRTGK